MDLAIFQSFLSRFYYGNLFIAERLIYFMVEKDLEARAKDILQNIRDDTCRVRILDKPPKEDPVYDPEAIAYLEKQELITKSEKHGCYIVTPRGDNGVYKTIDPFEDNPEGRKRYEEILAEQRKKSEPYRESLRESMRITAEDLSTRVGIA